MACSPLTCANASRSDWTTRREHGWTGFRQRNVSEDGRGFRRQSFGRAHAHGAYAAAVVAALTEPGHEGKTCTITGPAAITHSEIADALSAATGRQIAFVDVPPDAFRASLEGVLPDWQLDGLLEDYEHYVRGEAAAVLPTVAKVTGQEPGDITRFAHDYAASFTGQAG